MSGFADSEEDVIARDPFGGPPFRMSGESTMGLLTRAATTGPKEPAPRSTTRPSKVAIGELRVFVIWTLRGEICHFHNLRVTSG